MGSRCPRSLVQAEYHDVVAIAIGDQQPSARRIEAEIPWMTAPGRYVLSHLKQSVCLIQCTDYESVMATVGAVEVTSIRMNVRRVAAHRCAFR